MVIFPLIGAALLALCPATRDGEETITIRTIESVEPLRSDAEADAAALATNGGLVRTLPPGTDFNGSGCCLLLHRPLAVALLEHATTVGSVALEEGTAPELEFGRRVQDATREAISGSAAWGGTGGFGVAFTIDATVSFGRLRAVLLNVDNVVRPTRPNTGEIALRVSNHGGRWLGTVHRGASAPARAVDVQVSMNGWRLASPGEAPKHEWTKLDSIADLFCPEKPLAVRLVVDDDVPFGAVAEVFSACVNAGVDVIQLTGRQDFPSTHPRRAGESRQIPRE